MKNYYALLLCSLFTANAMAQQQASRLLAYSGSSVMGGTVTQEDSMAYTYSNGRGFDAATGAILYDTMEHFKKSQPSLRKIQSFGANNEIATLITQFHDGSGYVNSTRAHFYYSSNGGYDSVVTEGWNSFNKIWVPNSREWYSYNGAGDITKLQRETYNLVTAVYDPVYREVYTYSGGNLRSHTIENWNVAATRWEGVEQHLYLNNTSGKVVSDSMQLWDNATMQWVHQFLTTYTYNAGGQVTLRQEEDWDPNGMMWLSQFRHYFTYNSGGDILDDSLYVYNADSVKYVKSRLYTNGYDMNGNLITESEQYIQNGVFVNYRKKEFSYNSFDKPLLIESFQWDEVNMKWEYLGGSDKAIERFYYEAYDPATVKNIARPATMSLKLYPNPATETVQLLFEQATAQPFTVELYDVRGVAVKEWMFGAQKQYDGAISVNDVPEGHYLLRVRVADEEMTQRLLIAR